MSARKFEIGKRFAVFPFYEGGEIDPGGRIPILIGYGKAFGSGEHETTASCLEELEALASSGASGMLPGVADARASSAAKAGPPAAATEPGSDAESHRASAPPGIRARGFRGAAVLDLGSGTGILAIAAARLGARSVVAVEPDPEALEATIRNVRLNGVEAVVETVSGDVSAVAGRRFDLVLANTYGDVLVPIAPDVARLLADGGRVILSGIHYDFAYDVKTAYAKEGLRLMRSRALENYGTFVFGKP